MRVEYPLVPDATRISIPPPDAIEVPNDWYVRLADCWRPFVDFKCLSSPYRTWCSCTLRLAIELLSVSAPSSDSSALAPVASLIFACKSSQQRREWILYIKSRLKSEQYVESLRRLYLHRRGDSRYDARTIALGLVFFVLFVARHVESACVPCRNVCACRLDFLREEQEELSSKVAREASRVLIAANARASVSL